MSRVISAISEFFHQHDIKGAGVLAVSGGADSVALLRGIQQVGFPIAAVAHFNHQLRGEESDADQQFVIELANQLGLKVMIETAPIAELARKRHTNLEATARQERYRFLREMAYRTQADWLATGHTMNDQAETLLHRLMRGTGLQGLRGIAAVIPNTPNIVRPLLGLQRVELVQFLNELHQPYRTDATNFDTAFTRNRIRAELLPLMQTFNPAIVETLSRTAEQAEELHLHLKREVKMALDGCEKPQAGKLVILDGERFEELSRTLRVNLLRYVYEREGWPSGSMTAKHWHRLAELVQGDYPDGIHLKRAAAVVQLGPRL